MFEIEALPPGHLAAWFDPLEFAFQTGISLKGYTVKMVPQGWQVVVRGQRRDGENVYSLFVAVTLESSVAGLLNSLTTKGGGSNWYRDKFA